MITPTRWWWIRHAPVPGAPGRIHGQADVDCDTSDIDAFAAVRRRLPEGAVYVVSPLKRTRKTHAVLTGGALPTCVEDDFAEQSFGAWQGLSWKEMQARDPQRYCAFWSDPVRNAPPDGESFVDLIDRTGRAIERLNASFAGRDIVAVAHGGTIRAAVAIALGLTPEAALAVVIDNLSLTRLDRVADPLLDRRGGVWRIGAVNIPCRWIPARPL